RSSSSEVCVGSRLCLLALLCSVVSFKLHGYNSPMSSTPAPPSSSPFDIFDPSVAWETRLAFIVDTMREMSEQTDPQTTVRAYGRRMRQIMPSDASVSLSRRDLASPRYRITRSSKWDGTLNPWEHRDQLPVFDRGLLGRLIYGDEPII